ncbi:hypothetical protein D3C72_734080 [compost metagenome]
MKSKLVIKSSITLQSRLFEKEKFPKNASFINTGFSISFLFCEIPFQSQEKSENCSIKLKSEIRWLTFENPFSVIMYL